MTAKKKCSQRRKANRKRKRKRNRNRKRPKRRMMIGEDGVKSIN